MTDKLSDRDIAVDMLTGVKQLSSMYHNATMESANRDLRETFQKCHDEYVDSAKELFDYMNSKGWYRLTPAMGSVGGEQAGRS
ncbi:MAG: spore coat protein [Firmicutes bacterium]|nr:spore coat protein [Bacillota bacterium]